MLLNILKYSWVRHRYSAVAGVRGFLHRPWSSGVILLVCVAIAMFFANMEWSAHAYHELLTTDLSILVHTHDNSVNFFFPKGMNVEKFVNDGLMVIFFFAVGLEIKREIKEGELCSFKKAALPILAALGGMLAPALIYTMVNGGTPTEMGWGIPMATDIAFALAILSMLGDKVPASLKVFLTALAIADDLGAIIVIALFYGGDINTTLLLVALLIMAALALMNYLGEKRMAFYAIPAIVVWSLFYYSGVHATMSGVVMAMIIPSEPRFSKKYFLRNTKALETRIAKAVDSSNNGNHEHYHDLLHRISMLAKDSIPMTNRLEEILAPYIAFLVMPIFALVNGGVMVNGDIDIVDKLLVGGGSIGIGIIAGLVIGKPIGIFLMSWIAVKLKIAAKPASSNWMMIFAVSCLGGIGFTMSIFVNTLAFISENENYINQGKIAILIGSLISALLGVALINLAAKFRKTSNIG